MTARLRLCQRLRCVRRLQQHNRPLAQRRQRLLDVLGVMTTEQVRLILSDSNSSALVQEAGNDDSAYVVMPMRL